MHDERNELDRLLDSALATYADPGPDSGLESRILSRISTETASSARRRYRLAWAIALPAAAILLLFAGLSIARQMYAPHPASQQRHIYPQPLARPNEQKGTGFSPYISGAESARASAPEGSPHVRRTALAAQAEPLPKLAIFPTPQPLSPQEQALVNFAAHATAPERESLIAAQEQADTPLHISAIQIEPLQPPAVGAN